MANGVCDLDKRLPATHRLRVMRNGKMETLELCDAHYQQFRQGQTRSPFDSLFSGFDSDDFFSDSFPEFSSQIGYPLDRQSEAVNIEEFISESSKEVIEEAAQVAVKFGRPEVDTEHLLYALMGSDVVQEILKRFKLKSDDIRGYIDANAPKGSYKPQGERVDMSVSPRVKQVLENAFRVSRDLGHSYIGPEHLLIGLIQEDEGMGGDILRKYGLTPESLRQQVVKVVGKGAQEGRVETQSTTLQLDKYSRDLSKLAEAGKLDPVIGRTKEIDLTIEILARRTKNNPVLIGEPGVGKTAIVEGLAQRILSGRIPQVLQNKRVVELSLTAMVAGSKYRGEFEERVKAVVDEIVEHKDELIVFIDELHTVVGAGQGGESGGLDVANVLKPALARGELHLIGATTLAEYQRYIEKDAALERRLQPVIVAEPTVEQAVEILRGLRDRYEAHHRVKISDEAITAAAELSDRYITNRYLPDKAIDLIDQAASRLRISADTHSQELANLDKDLSRNQRELEYARNHNQMDKAKELKKEVDKLTEQKDKAESKWKSERGIQTLSINVEDVARVVSNMTGIPVSELTAEERSKLLQMETRLHERVIGQDEAVRAVSDAIRLSRSGLSERGRPIATFLFLGPTGVGKTELAKALAEIVFGNENALVRIDMSEYMERHSVARLIGSPPGYVGYEEGGQLTETVRRHPYSVILLDEIEKAHPDVYNILLQVLDDGRLTDGKGRVVDFTNTIIIATSNLGAHLIQQNVSGIQEGKSSPAELREKLMELLRQHFRPEFLNRLDEIIIFEALTKGNIRQIVELQLERVKRLARGQGIDMVFDDSIVNHLAEIGYKPEYGARELRRQIKNEIENKLAREILQGELPVETVLKVRYEPKTGVTLIPFTDDAKDDKKPKQSTGARRSKSKL